MEYKLLITKDAENDINEIISYIVNELKNPIAAGNVLSETEKSYKVLIAAPAAFPLCIDRRLRSGGYRKIPVKNYIIFFRVDEDRKTVYIMRVIYGRREYIKLI